MTAITAPCIAADCGERTLCETCEGPLCAAHDSDVVYCGRVYLDPVPVHQDCHDEPCSRDCRDHQYYAHFGA